METGDDKFDDFLTKGKFSGKQHTSPDKRNSKQIPPKVPSKKVDSSPDKKGDSPPNKNRGHHRRVQSYDMRDYKEPQ